MRRVHEGRTDRRTETGAVYRVLTASPPYLQGHQQWATVSVCIMCIMSYVTFSTLRFYPCGKYPCGKTRTADHFRPCVITRAGKLLFFASSQSVQQDNVKTAGKLTLHNQITYADSLPCGKNQHFGFYPCGNFTTWTNCIRWLETKQ